MSAPAWSAVDDETADLLSLVADEGHPSVDFEWLVYRKALVAAADHAGVICPNRLRPLLRGHVAPKRIAAFTHKALAERLVAYTGEFVISDDTEGRNKGKPCRELRLLTSEGASRHHLGRTDEGRGSPTP